MINWRVLLMSILRRGNLFSIYKKNLALQYAGDIKSIEEAMRDNAQAIFRYHLEHNPQYRKFLTDKGFDYSKPEQIKWEEIPIITKDDLKKYQPIVHNEVYNYSSSGGSTNKPFSYPASKECALSMWPNHWLIYEMCGGKPYDKVLMLMGYGARNEELKQMAYGSRLKAMAKKFYHWLSNFYNFNAFELDDERMQEMYELIKAKNIKFIYGYSSAINQFLRYLKDKAFHLELKGIFTTSDNKVLSSYELAKRYCNCEVYDQYGAHDGDIFTFECTEHQGLHILHSMSSVEIVGNEIILTAVKNKAFPFIRYRVGDIAKGEKLIKEKCKCGRSLFRLEGIQGRTTYYVNDKEGNPVSAMLFTYPLDLDEEILQYQLVDQGSHIVINCLSDTLSKEDLEAKYLQFFTEKLSIEIRFAVNQTIYKLANGKAPLVYKQNKD